MKKLVLSLAVLFSVAMVSCSNKEAAATDSDSVVATETATVVEEVVTDSVAGDSLAADTTVVAAEAAQ